MTTLGRILDALFGPPLETRDTSNLEAVIWAAIEAQESGVGSALNIPAVFSAVTMVSDTAGLVPLLAYRYDDDGYAVPLTDPPRLSTSPDPATPISDWVSSILWSMLTTGDAYLWLRNHDRDGHPREAIVLDPDEIDVDWNTARTAPVYQWRNRPMSLGFDLAHIPYNKRPGKLTGLSPIDAIAPTIRAANTVERFAREFWSHGAIPTMVLNYPHELTADEAEKLKAAFVKGQASRSPAVLSGGMTADPVTGFSPTEAQMLELQMFYVVEIARAFKIPAPMLQASLPSGSAIVYQNEGTLQRQFIQGAVQPSLTTLEQTITNLLPRGTFTRFDLTALLRPNTVERYESYAVALTTGFLTLEEVRKAETLPGLTLEDENLPIIDIGAE